MIKAIAIDDEKLALDIIEAHAKQSKIIDLVAVFTKPLEAIKFLKKYPIDLVFLDINMPEISGLSFPKQIAQQPLIIFTTAYSEYGVESYNLNAIHYLLKPINRSRFDEAVNRAKVVLDLKRIDLPNDPSHIYIRADLAMKKIILNDILYVEGVGDYLKIHLKDKRPIVARLTMKDLLAILKEPNFLRVHRSFIVPVHRILSVRNKIIQLPERTIKIGTTYYNDFLNKMFNKNTL